MASYLTIICLLFCLQITGCLGQVPGWQIAVLTLESVTIFIFILILFFGLICKCCRKCKSSTQSTIGVYSQHGLSQ